MLIYSAFIYKELNLVTTEAKDILGIKIWYLKPKHKIITCCFIKDIDILVMLSFLPVVPLFVAVELPAFACAVARDLQHRPRELLDLGLWP